MAKELSAEDPMTDSSSKSLAAVAPNVPVEDSSSDTEYVEYLGRAHERVITAADWEAAGIPEQGEVAWTGANGKRVHLVDLTEKALERLRLDGSFSVPARD